MNARHARITLILVGLSFSLYGCGGSALQVDFDDYSNVYGDSMNQQLLLNLAREHQQEPVYFIQLSQISSQYQFSGSTMFSTMAGRNVTSSPMHSLTLGGSLNAGFQQQPVFTFVPLNGTIYAQAIAAPIDQKLFNELYEQGYPADQLLRIMINEVRVKNKEGKVCILRNSPYDHSYADFLNFCLDMRRVQKYHWLVATPATLSNKDKKGQTGSNNHEASESVPLCYWEDGRVKSDKTTPSNSQQSTDNNGSVIFSGNSASLHDLVYAASAGLKVTDEKGDNGNDQYSVGKAADKTNISLEPNNPRDGKPDPLFEWLWYGEAKPQFVFRSFEAVLYCCSQEEGYFEALAVPKIRIRIGSSINRERGHSRSNSTTIFRIRIRLGIDPFCKFPMRVRRFSPDST